MGEIYVKKNNAFERVVSDGNTVIITGGGGGGGSGVTIASHAYRSEYEGDPILSDNVFSNNTPSFQGIEDVPGTNNDIHIRNLSRLIDRVSVNTSSLGTGQPFNSETGEFIAPINGVYEFAASVLTSGAVGTFYMWLIKNGNPNNILNRNQNRVSSLYQSQPDEWGGEAWKMELQAGDRVILCGGWKRNFSGPGQLTGPDIAVNEILFSVSYIGGASVTPVGPQACFVKSNGYFTPSQNGSVTPINSSTLNPATLIEVIDTLNEFDPVTGRFTAKTKGVYSVNFASLVLDGNIGEIRVWMQKTPSGNPIAGNTASAYGGYIEENGYSSGGSGVGVSVNTMSKTWLVEMDVGDVLTWYARASFDDNYEVNYSQRLTEISISAHLLTSTQTIGVNTDVAFSAVTTDPDENDTGAQANGILTPTNNTQFILSKSAPYTGASVSINEQIDNTNSFNPTTGQFTAPVAGWYEFDVSAEHMANSGAFGSVSNMLTMWLEKNNGGSVLVSWGTSTDPQASTNLIGNRCKSHAAPSYPANASFKHVVQLSVGDTVCLCAGANGSSTTMIYHWRFFGKLLRRA